MLFKVMLHIICDRENVNETPGIYQYTLARIQITDKSVGPQESAPCCWAGQVM